MQINLNSYPMLKARKHTQFFYDLMNDESAVNLGRYNLIVSHRDLKIYCMTGMKPNRAFKISAVKAYFGIKGNKEKLIAEFEALKKEVDELLGLASEP